MLKLIQTVHDQLQVSVIGSCMSRIKVVPLLVFTYLIYPYGFAGYPVSTCICGEL